MMLVVQRPETTVAEETAGCANRLTLHFLTPKGSDITLHMGRPIPSDQAANVSQRFRRLGPPRQSMKTGHPATVRRALSISTAATYGFSPLIMLFY